MVPFANVIVTPCREGDTVCTVAFNNTCCTDKNSSASCCIKVLNPLWSRDIGLSYENPPLSGSYVKLFPYINIMSSMEDSQKKTWQYPWWSNQGGSRRRLAIFPIKLLEMWITVARYVNIKKLPDNIPTLERKDLFVPLQPKHIRPRQKYRQDANLIENLNWHSSALHKEVVW